MIYKQENNANAFVPRTAKEIILEIELNGKIRFDMLLYTIYINYNITYKIMHAHIEYLDGNNFGNVRLLLKISQEELGQIEAYLAQYKLLSSKIDVLQKKEAS